MADANSPNSPSTSDAQPVASPESWRDTWKRHRTLLSNLQNQFNITVGVDILRVNQIDAFRLDVEMTSMLKEQFNKIFSLAQPRLVSRLEPELNAFLEFLIFYFTIWKDKPTPGCKLMNLRYRNEHAYKKLASSYHVRTGLEGPGLSMLQKLWYGFFTVGLKYAWVRFNSLSSLSEHSPHPTNVGWMDRLRPVMRHGENAYHLLTLVNLLFFLPSSIYSSIVERIIGARLVYEKPVMSRAVNFEYMNRQLVWHELSELALLLLPLINLLSIKSWIKRPSGKAGAVSEVREDCPICGSDPIQVAFLALPCKHLFCYYCLRTRCMANIRFKCPTCGVRVSAMQRYQLRADIGSRPGRLS